MLAAHRIADLRGSAIISKEEYREKWRAFTSGETGVDKNKEYI